MLPQIKDRCCKFIPGHLFLIFFGAYVQNTLASTSHGHNYTDFKNSANLSILHTEMGKRFENSDTFVLTSLVNISFEQCKLECYGRPSCLVLEYRVLLKYCRLLSRFTSSVQAPGYLTVSGFANLTSRSCGGTTACNLTEACDIFAVQCLVKECRYPVVGGPLYLGNQLDVGAKLIYNDSGEIKTITCDGNGQWPSWVGERYAGITCNDMKQSNPEMTSGFYRNEMDITVVCYFETDGSNWTVFQRRLDGSVDFYRNWENYKQGFGNLDGEFWLGLENIHSILVNSESAEFELRIDLEDWEACTKYALYQGFNITNETDNYRLLVGDYSGTAGDSLKDEYEPHNDQMFSTKDVDNDGYGYSCAQRFRGGWWYENCHSANLNGVYYHSSRIDYGFATGIVWKSWTGFYYSLKGTRMMMRETGP